mmetsp:Transcript_4239/g.9405  ORF Transcript_4239/g.9405 Transcript_4239/m.9405 type:complete len:224 (+) Transcript_4239:352-1023(+)
MNKAKVQSTMIATTLMQARKKMTLWMVVWLGCTGLHSEGPLDRPTRLSTTTVGGDRFAFGIAHYESYKQALSKTKTRPSSNQRNTSVIVGGAQVLVRKVIPLLLLLLWDGGRYQPRRHNWQDDFGLGKGFHQLVFGPGMMQIGQFLFTSALGHVRIHQCVPDFPGRRCLAKGIVLHPLQDQMTGVVLVVTVLILVKLKDSIIQHKAPLLLTLCLVLLPSDVWQ